MVAGFALVGASIVNSCSFLELFCTDLAKLEPLHFTPTQNNQDVGATP
jgi:hypothetical protein